MTKSPPYQIQRMVSLSLMIFGVAFLLFMIIVEDEPGAIPLGMIIMGAVWAFMIRNDKTKDHD